LLSFQTMELWSIGAIKKMVMSGLGFAVLPYITVQEELENGSLKIIKQDEAFEPIYSHILIKKKKWVSPIAHAFMEAVIDSIPSTSLRPVPLAE
ncbi:MAG: LysR substrate-binding domain-containing protein, partial [Exiguobacterium undae]